MRAAIGSLSTRKDVGPLHHLALGHARAHVLDGEPFTRREHGTLVGDGISDV